MAERMGRGKCDEEGASERMDTGQEGHGGPNVRLPHDWKLWPRHTAIYIISSWNLKRDSVPFFLLLLSVPLLLPFIYLFFINPQFLSGCLCADLFLSLFLSRYAPPPPSLVPFFSCSRSVTLYYLVLCFLPSPAPVQKMECDRGRCRFSHSLGCLPVVEGALATQTSAIQTDRP